MQWNIISAPLYLRSAQSISISTSNVPDHVASVEKGWHIFSPFLGATLAILGRSCVLEIDSAKQYPKKKGHTYFLGATLALLGHSCVLEIDSAEQDQVEPLGHVGVKFGSYHAGLEILINVPRMRQDVISVDSKVSTIPADITKHGTRCGQLRDHVRWRFWVSKGNNHTWSPPTISSMMPPIKSFLSMGYTMGRQLRRQVQQRVGRWSCTGVRAHAKLPISFPCGTQPVK